MKNQLPDKVERIKIPVKLIGQIILIMIVLFFFNWLINSVSFNGMNKLESQATIMVSSEEIFDTFGFINFDGKWNDSTWAEVGTTTQIKQIDGVMIFSREVKGMGGLVAYRRKWLLSRIDYVESVIILNSNIQTQDGDIGIEISTVINKESWFAKCAIRGGKDKKPALIICETADKFSITPIEISYDTWHVVRLEIDNKNTAITFFVDGQNAGKYIPEEIGEFNLAEYSLMLKEWASSDGFISGSFDQVQLKTK